jgi:uncharacterized protein (DUF1501 family)
MGCCEDNVRMPAPAGSGLDRRAFLARGAGLALAVYGSTLLKPSLFEDGIAAAQAADPGGRILVSVFCAGGIDSLSLIAPVGHPEYAALRPQLKVAENAGYAIPADPSLQWHPNATGLRDLHNAGKLTLLPAIGYTDPNQSHFTSRHYWEIGALDPAGRVGWLGRYLDRHGSATNPLQGLSLDWTLSPALAPATVPVAAVGDPRSYDFWTRNVWDHEIIESLLNGWGALGDLPASGAAMTSARNAARMSTALRAGLAPIRDADPADRVVYPTGDSFPGRLAALADMIELGLPLKCVSLEANGGYDTHDSQNATLPGDIALLSQSLTAFQADLEARGLADRVIVHVWSEFGRRAEENGDGTDHGAGGVSMIIGTQAAGGMVGEFTGIAPGDLDHGNLKHSTDFRAVYKTLCEDWFAVDPAGIVPDAAQFSSLPLLK